MIQLNQLFSTVRVLVISTATSLLLMNAQIASAQDKPAYLLYNKNGDTVSYSEVMEMAAESDMVFFGELHNNPIPHWLQIELLSDLHRYSGRNVILGMEMFETDQQILVDEYLSGLIGQNSFESEARLWSNYQTDYKPLVEFARQEELRLIGTNIPRRYASSVYRGGLSVLDSLSADAKRLMMPLPLEVDTALTGYRDISEAAHGHGGVNLIYSQAVKDATMAHFILLNMRQGDLLLHINGSYHSNSREGIIWYIENSVTGYNIFTLNTILAEDTEQVSAEELQAADITIVVPFNMTTTY